MFKNLQVAAFSLQ